VSGFFGQGPFGDYGFQDPVTTFSVRGSSLELDLEEGVTGGDLSSPRIVTLPVYSKTVTLPTVAKSVTLPTVAKSVTLASSRTSVTLTPRTTRIEDPDWLTSP
jgi:hypothetical protein